MLKISRLISFILLIVILTAFGALAEEKRVDLTDVDVFMYQQDVSVYAGETIELYSGIKTEGEITVEAYWAVNGWEYSEYKSDSYYVNESRDSTFYFGATDDMKGFICEVAFIVNTYSEGVLHDTKKVVSNVRVRAYTREDTQRVMTQVRPANVTAVVNRGSTIYSNRALNQKSGWVDKGITVYYDMQHKGLSAHIILPDGTEGWVGYYNINPTASNLTLYSDISSVDKSIYITESGYESDTDYLVWVNIQRQKVNVFTKSGGMWITVGEFTCAAGTNRMPTVKGVFKYFQRDAMWDLGSTCVRPALRFFEAYALHSIIIYKNGRVYDGTLGRPASHGCVRMAVNDINWIDKRLKIGTTIVVH